MLNDQLRHMKINEAVINKKKTEDSGFFSEVEYKHGNPVANLDMHTLTILLHMLQHMNENTPQHVVPQQSSKTQQYSIFNI